MPSAPISAGVVALRCLMASAYGRAADVVVGKVNALTGGMTRAGGVVVVVAVPWWWTQAGFHLGPMSPNGGKFTVSPLTQWRAPACHTVFVMNEHAVALQPVVGVVVVVVGMTRWMAVGVAQAVSAKPAQITTTTARFTLPGYPRTSSVG
jgi:hypothetical protein